MYARVARFEGGDADGMRKLAAEFNERGASGPPEGVPATGFTALMDYENGRGLAISLFETEEDLRKGDEALNAMDPAVETGGRRTSVEVYEVGAEFRR